MPCAPQRGVGLRHDDDEVGEFTVGDERLLPVEDPLVTVTHRRGPYPGEVAAGTRLAHRDGGHDVTGAEPRQPPLTLLLGGQVGQVRRDDVVVQPEPEAGHTRGDDLLDEDRVEAEVLLPAAAVLLVDVHAEQARRARLAPDFPVDDAGLVRLVVVRHRLAGQERLAQFPEGFVLGF